MPFVLFALAVAWTVMLLFGGLDFDRALLTLLYGGNRQELATAARFLTELGGWRVLVPLTLAGAAWIAFKRRFRDSILLVLIVAGGRFLVDVQKLRIERIRPEEHEHLVAVKSLSFPSAHAANSAIVYLSLALLLTFSYPRRAFALWCAAWLSLLIGASRVVLGVHWPSDVIAGWAFGLFWTLLLLRLSGHDLGDGVRRPPSARIDSDGSRPPEQQN